MGSSSSNALEGADAVIRDKPRASLPAPRQQTREEVGQGEAS